MMRRSTKSPDFPMPPEPAFASLDAFLAEHIQLIESLCVDAKCAQWELPREAFAGALWRSAEKRFRGARAGHLEVEVYLKSLHVGDLALAWACAAGSETAWEFFIAEFRSELRSAAQAILRTSGSADDVRAAELADSLYAELYGLRSDGGGHRKSLFQYFHGRSKLSTWLRAVLTQRHVDLLRTSGRTTTLEAEPGEKSSGGLALQTNPAPPDPDREMYLLRLGNALCEALAGLPARERMILACYYADQLTLAEIGRMLHEHESTMSRQLDRTRRTLRENVAEILRCAAPARDGRPAEPGLDEAQIEQAFEYALQDWPFDLSRALSEAERPGNARE